MKTLISNILITSALCVVSAMSFSQSCLTIVCSPDVTVANDSTACDATVNYTLPVGVDTCLSGSQTFTYTGAMESFIVPPGVTSITVDAYGAQGGANWVNNTNYGGYVQADIPVTPGSTLYIFVGEQPNGITGGWNGGGNGEGGGQGGGGASDIRVGGTTLNDRVIVAGGAGGAGYWSSMHVIGGAGGGLIGENGSRVDYVTSPGGEGGTQVSSGNGTCISLNNPAVAGGFGFGGAPSACGCEGYGGGGGWWGGAGSGNCRGGGGGSSYTDPTATNITHQQGVRTGHGEITLSWAGGVVAATQTLGLASGSVFPVGTTTNTFEVSDGIVTLSCSFDVIVLDTLAPTIICPASAAVCGPVVNGIGATSYDNCGGEVITYTLSGATTGSGTGDASGTAFNAGTTTVWYYVTDAAGNQDSSSFDLTVNFTPVSLASFPSDTICSYDAPVSLPLGTPASGVYAGSGISGSYFDPSISGEGTFYITYSYTDSNACVNSDTAMIYVSGCLNLNETSILSDITLYPNPTTGLISVQKKENNGQLNYTLYSLEGKMIQQGTSSSNGMFLIDLSNEYNGVYLLQIDDTKSIQTLRVVKQ